MAKARKGNKKMNEKQMERKIQQDSVKVKKDLNSMMEDSVSLVSKGLERLTGEAKDTLISTSETMKKDIGHGIKQYNTKVNELSKNVPGDLGKKVAQYPWVAISIGLGIGLLLGGLFKLTQRS
jgi:ElaB/YqjD/DUF883 family membrane-anchored ribosome-binding protein